MVSRSSSFEKSFEMTLLSWFCGESVFMSLLEKGKFWGASPGAETVLKSFSSFFFFKKRKKISGERRQLRNWKRDRSEVLLIKNRTQFLKVPVHSVFFSYPVQTVCVHSVFLFTWPWLSRQLSASLKMSKHSEIKLWEKGFQMFRINLPAHLK